MSNKKQKTVITAKVIYPDGEIYITEVNINNAHLTMEELRDLLERLCAGMGYNSKTVAEYLGTE